MFHNYFFLKPLSESLNNELRGLKLLECFSQNRDEIILGFASAEKQRYIRADLSSQIGLFTVIDDFKRAKRNSIDLFQDLIDLEVISVSVFEYERSFQIIFEKDYQLIFKMHASRSNLLLAQNDQVQTIFRNNLPADLDIIPSELNKKLDVSEIHFREIDGNPKQFIPALGKEVNQYLKDEGYDNLSLSHKWSLMQTILMHLEKSEIAICPGEPPTLSLLPTDKEGCNTFNNPLRACKEFFDQFSRWKYVSQEKNRVLKPILSEINKTESYLAKTYQKLEQIETRRKYDEIANIIMANLHQIPKGAKSITLDDFYSEEPITIKLNPDHSPQKNAETLYRKAKNQQLEINNLEDNLAARERELDKLKKKLKELEQATDIKSIRSLGPTPKKATKNPMITPYHEYEKMGFKVLVGKNARHNDELTLKIAKKDDLWLHAKDVAGSHVVIKHQAGKNYPKPVIEFAAQLAAAFSKRSNDSLCPVIYTPKKFIRKRKGDPPGAVVVEKEEVVMVTPYKYEK